MGAGRAAIVGNVAARGDTANGGALARAAEIRSDLGLVALIGHPVAVVRGRLLDSARACPVVWRGGRVGRAPELVVHASWRV